MGYTLVALEDKLLDMYPEIQQHGVSPRLKLDEKGQEWHVTLKKGTREFTAVLKKADADKCMDGAYCEDFGKEIKDIIGKF
jgi:hypothetical protein